MNTDQPVNLNEQPVMQSTTHNASCENYIKITSILNQVSGVFLFLSVPAVLWIYDLSLKSIYSFTYARFLLFYTITGRCLSILFAITFVYHVIMGMRYTLTKTSIGQQLGDVKMTSVVSIGVLLLTGLFFYF